MMPVHPQSYLQKSVYSISFPQISSHCALCASLRLDSAYLPSSRHAPCLHCCILKENTVSLHETVSLILIDAAAGLTRKPRLVNPCCSYDRRAGRAEVDNGVTNCVFLFSIPLSYFFPLLHSCPSAAHYLHPKACITPSSSFSFCSIP